MNFTISEIGEEVGEVIYRTLQFPGQKLSNKKDDFKLVKYMKFRDLVVFTKGSIAHNLADSRRVMRVAGRPNMGSVPNPACPRLLLLPLVGSQPVSVASRFPHIADVITVPRLVIVVSRRHQQIVEILIRPSL